MKMNLFCHFYRMPFMFIRFFKNLFNLRYQENPPSLGENWKKMLTKAFKISCRNRFEADNLTKRHINKSKGTTCKFHEIRGNGTCPGPDTNGLLGILKMYMCRTDTHREKRFRNYAMFQLAIVFDRRSVRSDFSSVKINSQKSSFGLWFNMMYGALGYQIGPK